MKLVEKLHSLLPDFAINKKLSDESLPVAPKRFAHGFDLPGDLPIGWSLGADGETWCEYSVLDSVDTLSHEAYAIFEPTDPLGATDDGAVLSRDPDTAWVRLGVGAAGEGSLSVNFSPLGLDAGAFAKGVINLHIPGDPDKVFGQVVEEFAAGYFGPGAFEPDNALPVGGGLEIGFDAGASFGATLDFSDLLAYGVNRLARAGASVVGFEPLRTSARIHFKATVEGGFLLQVGRKASTPEGDTVYRFRIATRKSSSGGYGVKAELTGKLDGSPLAAEFERLLGDMVGVPDLIPILAGEKGSEETIEKVLSDLKIPFAGKAAEKAAELVGDLRENLADNLKQEVGVRIGAQFSRSTSMETLYQWKSVIPAGGSWDAALRAALLSLDIDRIHEIVRTPSGRCTPEVYLSKRVERESSDVGFDLTIGRWMIGGRSTRDFVFTRSHDHLADTDAFAFDIGHTRLLGRLTDVDFWQAGIEALPSQVHDADSYDRLDYSFDFLWQSDIGEDGSRLLGKSAVGEAVDLLYALRPDLRGIRSQSNLFEAVCRVLDDAGWLGREGFATVRVETRPLPAAAFSGLAKKIGRRLAARSALALVASRAMDWRSAPHRGTVAVREEVFREFFVGLLPKNAQIRAAKASLRTMARSGKPDAFAAKSLGDELRRSLPRPLPQRKRAYKGREKFALGHPYQLADDIDEIHVRLGETLGAFRDLAGKIEARAAVTERDVRDLEKRLFRLARFGTPFEYRLFLLLVAEQLPLDTLTVAFRSEESDQSWPIHTSPA